MDDQGWYPFGDHKEDFDITEASQDYDTDESSVKDILEDVNIVCWITANSGDEHNAFIGLQSFLLDSLPGGGVSLDDMLLTAIDIRQAGAKMQLLALQKLQRTAYQAIEQTRQQLAERGGPL